MKVEILSKRLDEIKGMSLDDVKEELTFKTYENNESSLISQLKEIAYESGRSVEAMEMDSPNIYDITYDCMQADFDEEFDRMYKQLLENLKKSAASHEFLELIVDNLNAEYDYVAELTNDETINITSDEVTLEDVKRIANESFNDRYLYQAIDDVEFNDTRSFLYANFRMYYECDFNYALECMVEKIEDEPIIEVIESL